MSPEETSSPSAPTNVGATEDKPAPATEPTPAPEASAPLPVEPAAPTPPATPPAEPITPSTPEPTPPSMAVPESSPTSPPPNPLLNTGGGTGFLSLLSRARERIQFRKAAKLEKIVAKAREKGSIANDDVEKLLRVSDATATRYLAQLVKSGRLQAVGRTSGRRYTPVQ